MIRRENARIKRANRRRSGSGGDMFANPEFYAREEVMARLHLEMLKGVLAECLGKPVADLTPADWEIASVPLEAEPGPCRYNLDKPGGAAQVDTATAFFMCDTEVQAKG